MEELERSTKYLMQILQSGLLFRRCSSARSFGAINCPARQNRNGRHSVSVLLFGRS
jgi:hypothetical protein